MKKCLIWREVIKGSSPKKGGGEVLRGLGVRPRVGRVQDALHDGAQRGVLVSDDDDPKGKKLFSKGVDRGFKS
jgi:hypothetical protein